MDKVYLLETEAMDTANFGASRHTLEPQCARMRVCSPMVPYSFDCLQARIRSVLPLWSHASGSRRDHWQLHRNPDPSSPFGEPAAKFRRCAPFLRMLADLLRIVV